MTILYKYAKKFMEKKEQETINVGVVGYPNVGKSSVINVLKNKAVVDAGSHPFVTRSIQTVKLNKHVNLIDSPGALVPNEGENKIIRSALQVEDLTDPIKALENVMAKVEKSEILRMYRIGNYQNTDEMLDQIAMKKGLVEQVRVDGKTEKKGKKSKSEKKDVPKKTDAAKRVLRDFLNNRINYHCAPPSIPKSIK
jgi:nuclear GTP-binding protein